ncbi:MAG: LacI family DNA-binding transcriptional regulator [Phycisphaerales bacterium]
MAYLKDIAQAANVSIRTVNRALKGNGYVDTAVKQRVLHVAKTVGYSPNRIARSLRTGKSLDVVAVFWDVDELNMAKLAGLEDPLRSREYQLNCLFGAPGYDAVQERILGDLTKRRPAGVVIFSDRYHPERDLAICPILAEANIPYITVDSHVEGVDSVRIDRSQGVYDAVLHLAASGRQRIAYWGPQDDSTRLVGYLRAMQQLGRPPICLMFDPESDTASWRDQGRKVARISPLPDAIQAFSDATAFGLLAGLYDAGIRVPQQLAVVGFDDRPMAALAWPALTTVAQPCREAGLAAAEILLRKIEGKEAPPHGWSRTLPTRLVIRASA